MYSSFPRKASKIKHSLDASGSSNQRGGRVTIGSKEWNQKEKEK
jgi:hypothetical protein